MKHSFFWRVRAASWTIRSANSARKQLRRGIPPDAIELPRVPVLRPEAGIIIRRITRLFGNTCLERAVVLQRWYVAHGQPKPIYVGVTAPLTGFKAHAWLEGEKSGQDSFTELLKFEA